MNQTTNVNVSRESDGWVVPTKCPNKKATELAAGATAEGMEGSRPTKRNTEEDRTHRTQGRGRVSPGLGGVRGVAGKDKKQKFTALLHHGTVEALRDSYDGLKKKAAPEVDGVTWKQYGEELEEQIEDLHDQVHRGAYRAQPTKRKYHSQRGWPAAASGDRSPGGQDCPTGGGPGSQRDLRRGLFGILLGIPTRTWTARRAGCTPGGTKTEEGELGTGRGHSGILRQHESRMEDEIGRVPDCG